MTLGRVLRLALVPLAVALAVAALGAPGFTWANDGVRVEHPRSQALAALGAGVTLLGAAWPERRAVAVAGGAAALALGALAAQRLVYRVDAFASGLNERSLTGAVELAWRDVAAVEPGERGLTLRARDGRSIVIGTAGFAPDERSRLERTIARRVKDAAR